MRYEIVGETLPAVICTLEEGETMITEKGHELDVPEYEDGDEYQRRDRQSIREDVFRRVDFPEHVHCKRRSRNDRVCIQFSGKDRCT